MGVRVPNRGKRNAALVRGTTRSAWHSLWLSQGHEPPPTQPVNFLTKRIWPWIKHYLSVAFRPRRPLPPTPAGPRPCIIAMPDHAVVAMAGDWGTGTASAYKVADGMAAATPAPHVTIHLGDVYYSGTPGEYANYFLGADDWPRGTLATFALNGNHEMYSGGSGYFGAALPALGQSTSFFCLENAHWRVVGLDSGYYSGIFPLIEKFLRGRIRLPDENVRWLRDVVFADAADRRPVILLSHHQLFSEFDDGYDRLGRDLAPWLPKTLLWFWGHEHRLAGYRRPARDGYPVIRARCIGHGGMPVEVAKGPDKAPQGLVFHDRRQAGEVDGVPVGFCGYALLRFDGPALTVEYRDENGLCLLTETWRRQDGTVVGEAVLPAGLPPGQGLTVTGSISDLGGTWP